MSAIDFTVVQPTPGCGQPLEYTPTPGDPLYIGEPIPSALIKDRLWDCALGLMTLREIAMVQFMNVITDKKDWYKKVFDEEIVTKWRPEASLNEDFTTPMFDYCIEELRYIADKFDPQSSGSIVAFNGKVVKSDHAVPESIRLALNRAISPLEKVPDSQKDWHPGSKGKVLDLVHPSLYPLVYGKTRVLPIGGKVTSLDDCITRSGEGDVLPIPVRKPREPAFSWSQPDTYDPYSSRFQWLPCEVDISTARSRIVSYISNLHPQKHNELYAIIENLIDASIPLWEISIARLNKPNLAGSNYDFHRIHYTTPVYDPAIRDIPLSEGPQKSPGESEWDHQRRREEWWHGIRTVVQPEPKLPVDTRTLELSNDTLDLRGVYGKHGRRLQVIVKLANIELTPDKPSYEGGTWHVEGKLNEHICATAIYYHSCVNITESALAFRQIIGDDDAESGVDYEQNDHDWLQPIFGCEQDGEKVQVLGSVKSYEGRLVTFPNTLQHQVQPFQLLDPTQPGHRKIVALFLVDPNVRITSTASVPCQQLDWWKEHASLDDRASNRLTTLPAELQDQVFNNVDDFPISLVEAKEIRLELMEERRRFALDHQAAVEERTFSLCEH